MGSDKIMIFKRVLPAIMFSILLSACGLVDTEAAGEAVALKEQVLRIQTEQLDPLLDQLSDFQAEIEPLEQEIDDLESQRDELVDQGRNLANEFEREMRDRFEMVFQDEEGARREFENDIEDQFKDLDMQRRDLERGFEDQWADVEVQMQALFEESQIEIDAKRAELESTNNGSTPEMDALEEQRTQLRAAETALNKMRSEIQLKSMDLEERQFDLQDQMEPLNDQIEALHRQQQASWEGESSIDYNFLRQEAYEQIRNLQDELKTSWEAEEDAKQVDWGQRGERRRAAEDQHSATLQSINEQRSEAYAQADQSDIGAAAERGISSLSDDYENSRTKYQNLIVEVDAKIVGMGGGSESGQESSSELRAKLESTRLQYQDANDLLGTLDSIIRGGEESNPEFATAKQASDDAALTLQSAQDTLASGDAALTLQSAQDTLASTPAEIEGPADPDNPTADPVMIVHPDYLTAQTAVADAQLAYDTAQTAVADAQLAYDTAESVVATTPETLVTEDKPNPAYDAAKSQTANLQASVRSLELQQSNISVGAPAVVNPDLTAAYAEKTEYESIIKDLLSQYALDSKALGDKVSAGGESVDVSDVESDLESKVQLADQILQSQLSLIDTEQLGSDDKSGTITELERQIKALEDQARALEKEEQTYHRTREANSKEIRGQIRSLEDEQIGPLRDAQKDVETERRPLRKQQMVIDREQMLIQDQWPALEEQQRPLEEARQEMQQAAWQEFETWQRTRMKETEQQSNQARNDVQKEIKEAQREIEDQMYELEDKREGLEDAFHEEREKRIAELQGLQDGLREEKMRPLEIEAQELDDQIAVKWEALDVLYADQGELKGEIKELQIVVRDLDRQAEFGVLSVISGALENAEELEKSGGSQAAFESLLPDIGIGE
jgi:DNA repair exonuclease SbcCD ATPase subunit